ETQALMSSSTAMAPALRDRLTTDALARLIELRGIAGGETLVFLMPDGQVVIPQGHAGPVRSYRMTPEELEKVKAQLLSSPLRRGDFGITEIDDYPGTMIVLRRFPETFSLRLYGAGVDGHPCNPPAPPSPRPRLSAEPSIRLDFGWVAVPDSFIDR